MKPDGHRTMREIVTELRRPFPAETIGLKVQTAKGANALIVGYLDARQVAERLNEVCPQAWSSEFTLHPTGEVECRISITFYDSGVERTLTRADVGISEGGIGGLKAVYSDAFKRAAVMWGIGQCIYASPRMYVRTDSLRDGKHLTEDNKRELYSQYEAWLDATGKERFGEPLDPTKGEEVGDYEVEGEEESEPKKVAAPEPPAALPDEAPSLTKEEAALLYKGYIATQLDKPTAEANIKMKLTQMGVSGYEEMDAAQQKEFVAFLAP